jgi:hypothetical protein
MNITIVAVPFIDTTQPIMGPALLTAILKEHGINAIGIDLNVDIVNKIENHPNKQKIIDFFFSQYTHPDTIDDLVELVNHCSTKILDTNPDILALSLLTYGCQIFTRWLVTDIKQKRPNIKIVIGGPGIKNFVTDKNGEFYQQLISLKLVDDYIFGDAEESFVEYIKGNLNYPGINSDKWKPIPDLNVVPYPDYSNYDFSVYKDPVIPLSDSRGCIKNCEFCDVIEHWTKYQYRYSDNVFAEMLYQIEKHGITAFAMRNSLSNGNMKEFKKLLVMIADYNENKPKEKQISWEGFFIVRPPQFHPADFWELLGRTNAKILLGVESVIYHVRKGMDKTCEDSDIDYHLEMGQKHNVKLQLLMIVAYPTETLADYEYTKQWFRDRKQYANNSVVALNLSLASILPGTELDRRSDDYGIKKGNLPSIWINQNLNITPKQRVKYLLELQQVCKECGFFFYENQEQTVEHTRNEE